MNELETTPMHDEFVACGVDPDETSEEFTARIVAIIEDRMKVYSLRD